jgi:hypothetical protein
MATIFTGVRWNLSVILICVSFMAKDIEHFFMHLLAISTYFEICLFSLFGHLFCGLLILCRVSFLISLCVLVINPLLDVHLAKAFLPFFRLSLQSSDSFLCCSELFSLMKSHMTVFSLNCWGIINYFISALVRLTDFVHYLPILFIQQIVLYACVICWALGCLGEFSKPPGRARIVVRISKRTHTSQFESLLQNNHNQISMVLS